MAKSTHNKRTKAKRSLVRRVLYEAQGKKIDMATHQRLMKRTYGTGDDDYITRKKNAFRYPNEKDAVFPKAAKPEFVEKRNAYINPTLFIKNKGQKHYKLEQIRLQEEVEDALKKAEEEYYNEKNKIKVDKFDMGRLDNELSNFKNSDLIEDIEMSNKQTTVRNKKKEKKKATKSHKIINDK